MADLRRVLVVDDSPEGLAHLAALLRGAGYEVREAGDGMTALKLARAEAFDLALVDLVMPGVDGLALVRHLKGSAEDEFLPVMLLSARHDEDTRVEGLKVGADDFVGRPYSDRELLARIEAMLRIRGLQERLSSAKRELERLSVTDGLTGLYNHRWLQSRLKEEMRRAQRHGDVLHVLMLDLDHFKEVNDRFGHLQGDAVLRQFAEIMALTVRETDLLVRYGGEEFVVLLPRTNLEGASIVAERIRSETATRRFGKARDLNVTVSGGLVGFPAEGLYSPELLLRAGDDALYRAKHEGRNRIITWRPSAAPQAETA